MSSYKGKTTRNKSQTRKEIKAIDELNKQMLKDKNNPLSELLNIQNKDNDINTP